MKVALLAATPAEHAVGTPGAPTRDFAFSSYNYAIGLLHACVLSDPLARERVELVRFDLPLWRAHDALSEAQLAPVVQAQPEVVGLSCYCWSVDALLDAAAFIKRHLPATRIVAGGPSVSLRARRLLEQTPHLDIVVRGEAERAFVQLCRQQFERAWEVPNVTCRGEHDGIMEHPEQHDCGELSELPSAYLTGVLVPRAPTLLLEPSRGCRFKCAFCGWSVRGGPLRHAPAERVASEVRWALQQGYQGLNFCDTAINHDTESMRALCDILRREDPQRALSLSLFVRHEVLDAEQLAMLAELRCDEVIVGLESIHAAPLKACGKPPLQTERLEASLRALEHAGCKVTLSIMSGLPGDSVESFRATLRYIEELLARFPEGINFVCCFWLAVLPGTRFEAMTDAYGFETLSRGTPYLRRSRELSEEDLVQMARELVALAERNPRVRCEELHREAAARGAAGLPRTAAAMAVQLEPQPAASFAPLLAPWKPGQKRGAWEWVSLAQAAPGEGLVTLSFRHAGSASEVRITLSPLDPRRPCFAHTARYNVHFEGALDALPPDAATRLAQVVASLVAGNEKRFPA